MWGRTFPQKCPEQTELSEKGEQTRLQQSPKQKYTPPYETINPVVPSASVSIDHLFRRTLPSVILTSFSRLGSWDSNTCIDTEVLETTGT